MRRTQRLSRLAIAAASTLTTITMIAPTAQADSPARSVQSPAQPGTYTVKAGDNLFTIARTLKVRLADLLSANKLQLESRILPGDVLVVPPTATARNASAATVPAPARSAAPATAAATSYVLAKGEGLWTAATKHGVTLGALLKANKLTISSVVHPGTTLAIPAGGKVVVSPSTPAPGPAAAATPAAAPEPAAPAPASSPVDAVVAFARAQIGKPYKFFTAGPDTFDCSGLTLAAYRQIGVSLPHQSAMQSTRGTAVDWRAEAIRPGDLVFAFSSRDTTVIGHVGIAISATQWIHAPRAGDVVKLGTIPSADRIQSVRRLVSP